jgi:hypothetical protein
MRATRKPLASGASSRSISCSPLFNTTTSVLSISFMRVSMARTLFLPGSFAKSGAMVVTSKTTEIVTPPAASIWRRAASSPCAPTFRRTRRQVVEPNTPALRLETDYGNDAFGNDAFGNKTSVTVSGVDIVTRSSTAAFESSCGEKLARRASGSQRGSTAGLPLIRTMDAGTAGPEKKNGAG